MYANIALAFVSCCDHYDQMKKLNQKIQDQHAAIITYADRIMELADSVKDEQLRDSISEKAYRIHDLIEIEGCDIVSEIEDIKNSTL